MFREVRELQVDIPPRTNIEKLSANDIPSLSEEEIKEVSTQQLATFIF